MKIYQSDKVQELSYINLLEGLVEDIQKDDSMPVKDKIKAKKHLNILFEILEKYSRSHPYESGRDFGKVFLLIERRKGK